MYQRVNQFKKGYQHTFSIIRNKKGELAMNTREKPETWKEYFDKFLNTEEPRELNISKKLKLRLNNTIIDKTLTYASETRMLTTRDGEKLNIFERKVYRRILGPVYGNEKENWRILTNKEIYASVKKPTRIETVRLNTRRLQFGHVHRMEENRIWEQQD